MADDLRARQEEVVNARRRVANLFRAAFALHLQSLEMGIPILHSVMDELWEEGEHHRENWEALRRVLSILMELHLFLRSRMPDLDPDGFINRPTSSESSEDEEEIAH